MLPTYDEWVQGRQGLDFDRALYDEFIEFAMRQAGPGVALLHRLPAEVQRHVAMAREHGARWRVRYEEWRDGEDSCGYYEFLTHEEVGPMTYCTPNLPKALLAEAAVDAWPSRFIIERVPEPAPRTRTQTERLLRRYLRAHARASRARYLSRERGTP